jgi:hypothetical protein
MRRVTTRGGVVAACVWDFRGGMPLLDAYWAAARALDGSFRLEARAWAVRGHARESTS